MMSEHMSALDMELLGETTQVANSGPEEPVKAEETVAPKSEDQVDDTDDNKHSIFGPDTAIATATDNMELDEVCCISLSHITHRRQAGDPEGSHNVTSLLPGIIGSHNVAKLQSLKA